LLDTANQLIDIPALNLEIVVGQLPPLLLDLTTELVPLSLQFLGIDRHRV
jgi:hypothetical protein